MRRTKRKGHEMRDIFQNVQGETEEKQLGFDLLPDVNELNENAESGVSV